VAPNHGHWIKIKLLLPQQGDRDAIGAEATVRAGGKGHWAILQPATSYLASHEPVLHFGLGAATSIDGVDVLWPDGLRETFNGVMMEKTVALRKGAGKVMAGK
jgi:hypothetical protein